MGIFSTAATWFVPAAAPLSAPLADALGLQRTLPAPTKGVALTFDDGPHREGTPATLELLRDAGARATFFLVGEQVDRYPELAAAIAASGHEIGLHGYRHRLLLRRSVGGLARDLDRGGGRDRGRGRTDAAVLQAALRRVQRGRARASAAAWVAAGAVVEMGPRLDSPRDGGDDRAQRRRRPCSRRHRVVARCRPLQRDGLVAEYGCGLAARTRSRGHARPLVGSAHPSDVATRAASSTTEAADGKDWKPSTGVRPRSSARHMAGRSSSLVVATWASSNWRYAALFTRT